MSPALCFLEAAAALCGEQDCAFVESPFPSLAGLGDLPAGFVSARVAQQELLLSLSRRHLCTRLDDQAAAWPQAVAAETSDVRAGAAELESVLASVVDFVLWVHPPAYAGHTRPAVLRGAGLGGAACFLYAYAYCRRRQVEAALAAASVPWHVTLGRFERLLEGSEYALGTQGFLHGAKPQMDDLVLFAHINVLSAIPEELLPWQGELPGLQRVKRHAAELEALFEVGKLEPREHTQSELLATSGERVSARGFRLDWGAVGSLLPASVDEADSDEEEEVAAPWASGPADKQVSVARRQPDLVDVSDATSDQDPSVDLSGKSGLAWRKSGGLGANRAILLAASFAVGIAGVRLLQERSLRGAHT